MTNDEEEDGGDQGEPRAASMSARDEGCGSHAHHKFQDQRIRPDRRAPRTIGHSRREGVVQPDGGDASRDPDTERWQIEARPEQQRGAEAGVEVDFIGQCPCHWDQLVIEAEQECVGYPVVKRPLPADELWGAGDDQRRHDEKADPIERINPRDSAEPEIESRRQRALRPVDLRRHHEDDEAGDDEEHVDAGISA